MKDDSDIELNYVGFLTSVNWKAGMVVDGQLKDHESHVKYKPTFITEEKQQKMFYAQWKQIQNRKPTILTRSFLD